MKVLIAGLGSVGQRHARNLRTLLGHGVDLLAFRVRGLPHVITDAMTLDTAVSVEDTYGIRAFARLDKALAERPTAVLVCNPSSLHLETAQAAADAGCHVLIEKPLSHSAAGLDRLSAAVARHRLVATVGYQLRFHPALRQAHAWWQAGAIGRLRAVRAEFGEYLPGAHPYEDYRQSYAARHDLGGGVILCYSHEFDYLTWWFGLPQQVHTTGGRLGDLDLDVEDTAVTTMDYHLDGRDVTVELRLSFLTRPATRACRLDGDAGVIDLDLITPTVTLTTATGVVDHRTFPDFTRNQLFLDEVSHFLGAIAGAHAPMVPLDQAARGLRVTLAARESLALGRPVALS